MKKNNWDKFLTKAIYTSAFTFLVLRILLWLGVRF